MKAYMGVGAESSLAQTVIGTAANANDVKQAAGLLHGEETELVGDAGYQGVAKREEAKVLDVNWHVAMRPGKRKALDKNCASQRLIDELETLKASIRVKTEQPIRVIKLQFGFAQVRFKGLGKNTARLQILFAMSNPCMCRKLILQRTQVQSMG